MLECLNNLYNKSTQRIDLNSKDIIRLDYMSTSKGNQPKYYDLSSKSYIKGQFEYQGIKWKDYIVENLSSIIGSQLNTDISIVEQEIVKLSDGTMGVISKDFAINKQWVPMIKFGECKPLLKDIGKSFKVYNSLIKILSNTGIDENLIREYFMCMIILDFLLGNEDRHYNNFGILRDINSGDYEIAPLFDFGLGLFECDRKYLNKPIDEAIQLIEGKPFDRDIQKPVDMLINVEGKDRVRYLCKDIRVPEKDKFPSELGYQYFLKSYDYLNWRIQ